MPRLPLSFFERSADIVAQDLIGCVLCIKQRGRVEKLPITEVEAYMGPHDLACHSSRGRTQRTEVMYEKAGTLYIYLVYGMHHMLNIVTGPKEYPAAVLIRSVGEYQGPGKLTKKLKITRTHNKAVLGRQAGLWIESSTTPKPRVVRTPRIGVDYAKHWAKKKLRFLDPERVKK